MGELFQFRGDRDVVGALGKTETLSVSHFPQHQSHRHAGQRTVRPFEFGHLEVDVHVDGPAVDG